MDRQTEKNLFDIKLDVLLEDIKEKLERYESFRANIFEVFVDGKINKDNIDMAIESINIFNDYLEDLILAFDTFVKFIDDNNYILNEKSKEAYERMKISRKSLEEKREIIAQMNTLIDLMKM